MLRPLELERITDVFTIAGDYVNCNNIIYCIIIVIEYI